MFHTVFGRNQIKKYKSSPSPSCAILHIFLFLVILIGAGKIEAQESGSSFGIKFSGFVKTDAMWDTRQTVAAREGHYLLYPMGPEEDLEGEDINARPNFNILAIQTRLKGAITGPDAFGAKTGGLIEAAFFGTNDGDVNGFRLRHAFLTLVWPKSSLMIGQYWHPMFVTTVFPGTVSFNTGAPFQPFSRNPQIRWTYNSGNARIMAAAMAQRDFTSTGPDGASSKYLRNSAIPNLHLQLQWNTDQMIVGVGGDWKNLAPRLETVSPLSPDGIKSTNTVSSVAALAFARFNFPDFVWKVEGVYGQNMTDHLMLGGYGVESIEQDTGQETYLPTTIFSAWTDIETGKEIGFGLFAGITQNLGAANDLITSRYWARGENIDTIYRISPRVMWNSNKTRLAAEVEYTAASYGNRTSNAQVEDAEFVANIRLLLAAYYFF